MTSEAKPVLVLKTDPPPPRCSQNGQGCPSYAQLIYPMLKHRVIHVPTRYRLLVLHFQYTFVSMKENLELKSHCVKHIPYATGAACFSQFSKLAQYHDKKITTSNCCQFSKRVYPCVNVYVLIDNG